jgi:hypothetical protein
MTEIEIPQTQWGEFGDTFTRQHHGRATRISRLDTVRLRANAAPQGGGAAPALAGLQPLQEVREGRSQDRVELMVTVGRGRDETSVLIEGVVALYSRSQGDTPRGLRIDSGDGTSTLIEFPAAAGREPVGQGPEGDK